MAGFGLFLGPSPRLIAATDYLQLYTHRINRPPYPIRIIVSLDSWNISHPTRFGCLERQQLCSLYPSRYDHGPRVHDDQLRWYSRNMASWGSISCTAICQATQTLLIFSVLVGLFAALNIWYLSRQNKAKAIARGSTESSADAERMGDRSPWFVYSM